MLHGNENDKEKTSNNTFEPDEPIPAQVLLAQQQQPMLYIIISLQGNSTAVNDICVVYVATSAVQTSAAKRKKRQNKVTIRRIVGYEKQLRQSTDRIADENTQLRALRMRPERVSYNTSASWSIILHTSYPPSRGLDVFPGAVPTQ